MSRIPGLLLLAALVVVPFFNGGVTAWGWAGFAAAAAIAGILAALPSFRIPPGASRTPSSPARPVHRFNVAAATTVWWLLLVGLAVLQLVPLPADVLRTLSPERAELAEEVALVTAGGAGIREPDASPVPSPSRGSGAPNDGDADASGGDVRPARNPATGSRPLAVYAPLSFHPENTFLSLCWIVILAGVYGMVRRRSRLASRVSDRSGFIPYPTLPPLATAFVLLATVQAGLASIQYASRLAGSAAWLPMGLGRLTGTYVNKNGLGCLLAMAMPVTAAILVERFGYVRDRLGVGPAPGAVERIGGRHGPVARRPLITRLIVALGGEGGMGWPAFALAVQVLGLVLCLSRGAMAAGAVGLGVLMASAVLGVRRVGSSRSATATAWLGGPILLALLVGVWVGLDQVLIRWANLPGQEAGRLDWWVAAWNVFKANPAAGAGLGAFADAFFAHRTGLQPGLHVAHAHNDYAEALASLGVPGGLLAAVALGLLAVLVVRAVKRQDWMALGCGAGLAALAVHAFVDFPLAYPANAAWAAALGGMMGARGRRRGSRSRLSPGSGTRRIVRFARMLVPVAAAVPLILHAFHAAGWKPVQEACREIRRSGRVPAWMASSRDLPAESQTRQADRVTPEDLATRAQASAQGWSFRRGEAWRSLGTLQHYRAGRASSDVEAIHARRQAVEALSESLRFRPAVGEAWLDYADALVAMAGVLPRPGVRGRPDPEREAHDVATRAVGRAGRLDPHGARIAIREADFWIRLARRTGESDADRKAWRRNAMTAYGRVLQIGQAGASALHLRDAWVRGGSTPFLLGCIPHDRGSLTDRLFFQAAKMVVASAPVAEADAVLLEWRAWRLEEAGRLLAKERLGRARELAGEFVPVAEGGPAEVAAVFLMAGGKPEPVAEAGLFPAQEGGKPLAPGVDIRDRTFKADGEESFRFEGGGTCALEVDGRTRLSRSTGMAGNWGYNPCLLLEARIDGLLALRTFLPLDAETAEREGRPWAGLVPPPYRVRLRLESGPHRLVLRFRSCEDVTGGGRPSGVQSGEIVRLRLAPE